MVEKKLFAQIVPTSSTKSVATLTTNDGELDHRRAGDRLDRKGAFAG